MMAFSIREGMYKGVGVGLPRSVHLLFVAVFRHRSHSCSEGASSIRSLRTVLIWLEV